MKIVGARGPGSKVIGKVQWISRPAKARLKWMDHYAAHQNAALTCRYFGISRQTFYRWKRRYNSRDLTRLEDRSHRPRRRRQPTWSRELALAVLHLREQYPRWGKDKLAVLLHREGWVVSTSMVGRILTYLEGPWGPQGAAPQWCLNSQAAVAASLRRTQAQRVPCGGAGGPGAGGYSRRQTPAGGNTEALHCQGRGVPLGCGGGAHQSYRQHHHGLSDCPPGQQARMSRG